MPHWTNAIYVPIPDEERGKLMVSEFKHGTVGIVSRSGTLCYEAVGSTSRANLGQSTVIGIGGDRTPGTRYIDALEMLAADQNTKGT